MIARLGSLRRLNETYRTLGWLCLVVCTNQLGFGLIVPVVPAFARSFGVSQALAGLVISVYGLGRLLFDLPMGGLTDRFGRRSVIVAGEIITAVGSFLCGSADSFGQLVFFRFIAGVGAATVLTGAQVVLADISTPENRPVLMNTYQGLFLAAVGIGPSVGGIVADALGVRAPFFGFAALSLAAAGVCAWQVPETRHRARDRRAEAGMAAIPPVPLRDALAVLLRRRGFLLIGLVSFTQFAARTGALFNVVPLMGVARLGLSASAVGVALSVASLMNLVTIPLSTLVMRRYGRKGAIVPSTLVCGLAFATFALAYQYPVFLLATVLWGLGGGVGGAAPGAYAADMAPRGANGATMGAYATLADAGYVLGPFLLGLLADLAGYSASLLTIAALFVVAASLFALFAPETVRGTRQETA